MTTVTAAIIDTNGYFQSHDFKNLPNALSELSKFAANYLNLTLCDNFKADAKKMLEVSRAKQEELRLIVMITLDPAKGVVSPMCLLAHMNEDVETACFNGYKTAIDTLPKPGDSIH